MNKTLCLLLLICPALAQADFARTICAGPSEGPVQVIASGGACTAFADASGVHRFAHEASGLLVASQDGRFVAMVESYLPAIVRDEHIVSWHGLHEITDPPVIHVYVDGALRRQFRLSELIPTDRVQASISHVHWLKSGSVRFLDHTLVLQTRDERIHSFDVM